MAVLLELPNDSVWFDDHAQVLGWLNGERANWSWMDGAGRYQHIWNGVITSFQELNQIVNQSAQSGDALSSVISTIQSKFSLGPLVYSRSDAGERILDLYRRTGTEAGVVAFGLFRQSLSLGEIRDVNAFRALIEFAFPALGPVAQTIQDVTSERNNLRKTITELNGRVKKAEADRDKALRMAQWKGARRFIKTLKQMSLRDAQFNLQQRTKLNDYEGKFLTSVEAFKATETAYKEQMELQAPVTYWTQKAEDHKTQQNMLKFWVIGYFAVTIPAVIGAFGLAGGWLIGISAGGGKVDSPLYVVTGAGLAAVTTLVFWAGRLLTRFYLSQNHLHHDANDRAVMTTTYLALTSVRQADENDRAIILAALFRPSADGIVKDDGAPDMGVASVASKILTGGKP